MGGRFGSAAFGEHIDSTRLPNGIGVEPWPQMGAVSWTVHQPTLQVFRGKPTRIGRKTKTMSIAGDQAIHRVAKEAWNPLRGHRETTPECAFQGANSQPARHLERRVAALVNDAGVEEQHRGVGPFRRHGGSLGPSPPQLRLE